MSGVLKDRSLCPADVGLGKKKMLEGENTEGTIRPHEISTARPVMLCEFELIKSSQKS